MHISDPVLIAEIVLALVFGAFVVYMNKTRKYTKGLPWPLESVVVWLLNRVGGIWTEIFYNAVNRITALTAVYQVILRKRGDTVEVFLTPRNDRIYKKKVHHPGSMVRWTDKAGFFADAIARVIKNELAGFVYNALYLAGDIISDTPRGKEVSIVLVGEPGIMDTPNVTGAWYDVEKLPANLIVHELQINQIAVTKFCQEHGMREIVSRIA